MVGNVGKRWREMQGSEEWRGLLDPLDIDLRRNVLHYGEMAHATIDAFVRDKRSPAAGMSRYGAEDFFSKVRMSAPNAYRVTKFIYATASIGLPERLMLRSISRGAKNKESNWMGYVAVATAEGKARLGRRDIVVAWRGTVQALEWAQDLVLPLVSAAGIFGDVDGGIDPRVHRGFLSIYTAADSSSDYCKISAREQVLDEIRRLMHDYADEETSITITGHSLGAALSTLTALDIVSNGLNLSPLCSQSIPVTAFAFASPRVGDTDFQKAFVAATTSCGLRLLRVRNAPDIVPTYPPLVYCHVGVEMLLDSRKSPYLRRPGTIALWHNLQTYIHGIAGTQGSAGGFKMEVARDDVVLAYGHEAAAAVGPWGAVLVARGTEVRAKIKVLARVFQVLYFYFLLVFGKFRRKQ